MSKNKERVSAESTTTVQGAGETTVADVQPITAINPVVEPVQETTEPVAAPPVVEVIKTESVAPISIAILAVPTPAHVAAMARLVETGAIGIDQINYIDQYADIMLPTKLISDEAAARNNGLLLINIIDAITYSREENSKDVITCLLEKIERYSAPGAALDDSHRNRALTKMRNGLTYRNFIHLLTAVAPVAGRRDVLKTLDFDKATKALPTVVVDRLRVYLGVN